MSHAKTQHTGTAKLLTTVLEAADELRVGRSTVYELIRTKQLETVKIGRCTRIPVASIAAFVEQLRSPAA
ncbi:excisionase family DNA binding protein [Tardiphaga robiniae]|uniref:helix-turn-helix domain-containing protein n=1 Tax=Tardiphaga robiniae TaxID=943830 RepID=UPI0028612B4B|nr:excisionase family DNA binding protein [Tardiphaga robiniae]